MAKKTAEIAFYKRYLSAASMLACFALSASAVLADPVDKQLAGAQAEILSKYLDAASHSQTSQDELSEVDISAFIPKLKKQGHLRALREMSKLGQVTYRVLGFQGDGSVKREVISRYLEAEQQSQKQTGMALTPANYRFKLKGERNEAGRDVYVFQVSPRKNRIGLFKGEVWLDAASYLPVYEKGRLAKNPSIFFKKVDFERAYTIRNGSNVPEHLSSTIDTRIVGKVEVEVNFRNSADGSFAPQIVPVSAFAAGGY